MAFQHFGDLVHIGLGLGVLGLHLLHFALAALEEAEALLLGLADLLELQHKAAQCVAHGAQILGAHAAQRGLRKLSDVFLGGGAVLHDLGGVGDVNFGGKGIHSPAFFFREHTLIHNDGIDGFGLSRCGALGRQCQSGDGGSGRGALGGRGGALRIQRQLGDVFLFVHKVPPYLYLTEPVSDRPSDRRPDRRRSAGSAKL